jgi:tetratricopeptide (TPR) repeat protein
LLVESLDTSKPADTHARGRSWLIRLWYGLGFSVAVVLSGAATWWVQEWWAGAATLEVIAPLIRQQKWGAAQTQLRRYLAKHPDSPSAIMMLGRTLAGQGKFEECAQLLESIPADTPVHGEALLRAGQAWRHLNRRREAERTWRKCIDELPYMPQILAHQQDCRRQLAGMYALERRRAEFWEITWEMYERGNPALLLEPLEMRLRYEFEMVDPAVAMAELQAGKDTDANDILTRRAIGIYYLEAGEAERARAELFLCIQALRNDWRVWDAWLLCLYKTGDYTGLQQAVEDLPPSADNAAEAWKFRSLVAEHGGKLDDAIAAAERAVQLNPSDPELWYRLSQLAIRSGDAETSQKYLARSQTIKEQLDKLREAHRAYVENWETQPQRRPEIAFDLGHAFEQLVKPQDAEGWYRVALRENPTHGPSANALRSLQTAASEGEP